MTYNRDLPVSSTNPYPVEVLGSVVQLLDSKFDNVSGFDYVNHKNEFGYTSNSAFSACFPILNPTYNANARHTPAWTISPLNTVVYHGCAPFDNFGTNGVPARPDAGTGYAVGVFAINGNLDVEACRLEYGLDVSIIRDWYLKGKATWTFSVYFAALPGSATIMQQNLTNPTGQNLTGFINWEPSAPPCAKNNLKLQIVDILGSVIVPKVTLVNYTVDSLWHKLTYSFTLGASQEKFLRPQGNAGWQLQLIVCNEGHPRHLLYNPTLTLA